MFPKCASTIDIPSKEAINQRNNTKNINKKQESEKKHGVNISVQGDLQ